MQSNLHNIKIPLAGIVNDSIVDGTGMRLTIFVQGCPHKCQGCHNPHTHALEGGTEYTLLDLLENCKKNPLLSGITFSGGEPFLYAKDLAILAKEVKLLGLNVWCYTGYVYEELLLKNNSDYRDLLSKIDVLIDGPFILSQKDILLKFKGSKNQRIINLSAMRVKNTALPIILN